MNINELKKDVKQAEKNILGEISKLQEKYPNISFEVNLASHTVQKIGDDAEDHIYYVSIKQKMK
jgi:hypothetical protein